MPAGAYVITGLPDNKPEGVMTAPYTRFRVIHADGAESATVYLNYNADSRCRKLTIPEGGQPATLMTPTSRTVERIMISPWTVQAQSTAVHWM